MIRLLVLSIFLSSNITAQQQGVSLTPEDSVRNMIESLPEVREANDVYDSLTQRRQNIILNITAPDDKMPYYYIQAGYQGGSRFHPHFYFYVDLPNQIIYIEDMEKGDRTTIEQWRLRRNTSPSLQEHNE